MTTMTIPDHLRHLPVVGGRPVPWVVVWSAEKQYRAEVQFQRGVGIVGGRYTTILFGMTFVAVPSDMHGRPEWRETHSLRQRRCMLGPRCQVCGHRIEGTPVWLIPDFQEHFRWWVQERWTMTPPVCEPCADAAVVWCPHLAARPPTVVRGIGTPVAAQCRAYTPDGREAGGGAELAVILRSEAASHAYGRQLIVRVDEP